MDGVSLAGTTLDQPFGDTDNTGYPVPLLHDDWTPVQQAPTPQQQNPILEPAPHRAPCQPTVVARLMTPTFDGSTNPLPWISMMQLLFRLQHMPTDAQVQYMAFHQTDAMQGWYIRMTKEVPTTEWATFMWSLIHDFGPSID